MPIFKFSFTVVAISWFAGKDFNYRISAWNPRRQTLTFFQISAQQQAQLEAQKQAQQAQIQAQLQAQRYEYEEMTGQKRKKIR